MSEKILIADLIAAVADVTAIQKNRCDVFVKSFFEVIAGALAVDGVAKVKGLGTFKLVQVDERKSVNVQTGEEMIIPFHYKVSFTPDKSLKDDINKPFAHLKTYVVKADAPLDPPEQEDEDSVVDSDLSDGDSAVAPAENADDENKDGAEDTATSMNSSDSQSDLDENLEVKEGVEVEAVSDDASDDSANNVIREIKNEAASHSDWFDNWEVEYDGANPESPAQDVANGNSDSSRPVSLSSLLANKGDDTSDDDQTDCSFVPSARVNEEKKESSSVSEVENNLAESPSETNNKEVSSDVDPKDDESQDDGCPVASADQQEDDVKPARDAASIASNEGSGSDNSNITPLKVTEPAQHKVDVVSSGSIDNNVQHGKVIGVAIIAFLAFIGAAIYGINKIDPEFFYGLKASSDSQPVMPLDTTSLAQELSVYKNDVSNFDSEVEEQVMEEVTDELSNNSSAEVSLDPLWDGEFVAYMNRNYPDCSLETKGLKDEVTIQRGVILTMVALENYGDKSYWIYLYLYNKDRIKNPNNVIVGTKIRVPELDKSLVDGTNESKISIAKQVRAIFVK